DRGGRADVVAVAQPAAEQVVAAGGEVPVPESGDVGDQDVARDVAAGDELARRDPRLAARPAGDRRRGQQVLTHGNGRLVEVGHSWNRVYTEVLHHRDHVLDRSLDVRTVTGLAVKVFRREHHREQRLDVVVAVSEDRTELLSQPV